MGDLYILIAFVLEIYSLRGYWLSNILKSGGKELWTRELLLVVVLVWLNVGRFLAFY
jgi:hypothetical protein